MAVAAWSAIDCTQEYTSTLDALLQWLYHSQSLFGHEHEIAPHSAYDTPEISGSVEAGSTFLSSCAQKLCVVQTTHAYQPLSNLPSTCRKLRLARNVHFQHPTIVVSWDFFQSRATSSRHKVVAILLEISYIFAGHKVPPTNSFWNEFLDMWTFHNGRDSALCGLFGIM